MRGHLYLIVSMSTEFSYTFVSPDTSTYQVVLFYAGSLLCYYSDGYQLLCRFRRVPAGKAFLKRVFAEPEFDLDLYEKHSDAGTLGLYFGFRDFRNKINQNLIYQLDLCLNPILDQ